MCWEIVNEGAIIASSVGYGMYYQGLQNFNFQVQRILKELLNLGGSSRKL